MQNPQQAENPDIRLIETNGEVTLAIDDDQAMQGWEHELMCESADLLCTFGSQFLEVGLGLGISALRIASNPGTQRHVVVEKYAKVIELFYERNPTLPAVLEIVHADFFDYITRLEPGRPDFIGGQALKHKEKLLRRRSSANCTGSLSSSQRKAVRRMGWRATVRSQAARNVSALNSPSTVQLTCSTYIPTSGS